MKKIIIVLMMMVAATSYAQKISDLPTATGTGAGGYLPIVQQGVTKKIMVDSLPKGVKIDTSAMLAAYRTAINTNTSQGTANAAAIQQRLNITDTAAMLAAYRNSINNISSKWGAIGSDIYNLNTGKVSVTNLTSAGDINVGDKTTTYGNYNSLTIGGTTKGAVLDFQHNGVRKGQFYTNNTAFNFYTGSGIDLNFYTNSNTTTPAISASSNGNVGIGVGSLYVANLATGSTPPTTTGVTKLAIVDATGTLSNLSAMATAPTSSTATGTTGEVRFTATFIYVCTATNTWVRSALTTF